MATYKGRRVQTAILADEQIIELLDRIARREEVSRADVIRRALREWIEQELQERPLSQAEPAA